MTSITCNILGSPGNLGKVEGAKTHREAIKAMKNYIQETNHKINLIVSGDYFFENGIWFCSLTTEEKAKMYKQKTL